MKSMLLSVVAALAVTALSLPVAAQQNSFDTGMIPGAHILIPDGELRASVFLISDAGGWGADEQAEAEALKEKGAAVVGIDFAQYLKALRADDGSCVYMISDIEALAHQVQRSAGAASYKPPIVAGIGEGGALALAMISQSPAATIGEAIAVDPLAGIPLEKQLCTPASKETVDGRTIYGFVDGDLPAPVSIRFSAAAPAAGRNHATALATGHSDIDVSDSGKSAKQTLAQVLEDRIGASGSDDDPLGLPITVLDASPKFDTMAIIYSGDGGWRDIDKQIGGELQERGIPVIGVDSLRYFWSERQPQETADDLARIIDTYRVKWGVKHVLLVGYSFGADVLPRTYTLLSQKDKARVPQITLLALSRQVDYEVSVEGWLGVAGAAQSGDPVEDIGKIDPHLVQCIYGKDEDQDPCPMLAASGVESIGIDGGHHFDGDYKAIAGRIIQSLQGRLAKSQ